MVVVIKFIKFICCLKATNILLQGCEDNADW